MVYVLVVLGMSEPYGYQVVFVVLVKPVFGCWRPFLACLCCLCSLEYYSQGRGQPVITRSFGFC